MTWTTCQLGAVLTLKRGYDLPKKHRKEGSVPVVSSSGITGYHDKAKVRSPAVVTGRYGTLGKVYYVEQNCWPLNTALYVVDFQNTHRRFAAYFLKNALQGYRSDKAAVPGVDRNVLHRLDVRIPDFSTQRTIASTLSAYDDLIENNRRRIQLLERAARLLYREWFVHLRFPGHQQATKSDAVPVGWKERTLGDMLLDLQSGARPKGGATSKGIPSIGAENVLGIGRYDYAKEKYVPHDFFARMRRGVVKSRDVVVYKDGANIGRSSYFGDRFPHRKCAVNEHVFILRAIPEVGQNLLFFWVAQDETRRRIANLNANTAQPGVSQKKLRTLEFVQPEPSVARLFNEVVEPTVRQVFRLARMNRKLAQARDLLLPRLMNGEISV